MTTVGVRDRISQMYTHIQEPVYSYQNFVAKTCFPELLKNKLSGYTKTQLESFLNAIRSNSTGAKSLTTLRANVHGQADSIHMPQPNSTLANLVFTGSDNFMDNVINVFNPTILPIGPEKTLPPVYLAALCDICSRTYYCIYTQISKALVDNASALSSNFPSITLTTTTTRCTNFIAFIANSVTFYSETDTLDLFVKRCYDLVYNTSSDTSFLANLYNYELFASAFLPYFSLLYITKYIANANLKSGDAAPRDGVIRRFAILCVYKFILYTIFACYQYSGQYNPSMSQTTALRHLLDSNVTNVFDRETSYVYDETSISKLHDDTRSIFATNNGLISLSSDIELARNTTTNIASNITQVAAALKTHVVWKWVWVSILLIFLTVFIAGIYLKSLQRIYLGSGVVLLVVLLIVVLVKIVNGSSF